MSGQFARLSRMRLELNEMLADIEALEARVTRAPSPVGDAPLKWKYYKALLTQAGKNAPVARVLNRDEPDYLGDIVWTRDSAGVYITDGFDQYDSSLVAMNHSIIHWTSDTLDASSSNIGYEYLTSSNEIHLFSMDDDQYTDGMISDFYIEIAVRQRGEAPVLVSAETDVSGEKIIMTFDKDIVDIDLSVPDSFKITGTSDSYTYDDIVLSEDLKVITLKSNNDAVGAGDNPILTFTGSQRFETLDYGQLVAFTDFPITNNVPEPEE